jgi:hypothetical protein
VILVEIKRRNWIGHMIRKRMGVVERNALDWKPQGSRRTCGGSWGEGEGGIE